MSTFHLVAWLVVQRPDGAVLLARRAGAAYGAGLWGLPGGHVEDDETLAQTAAREGREEVGVEVDPAALTALGVTRYVDGELRGCSFFYLATTWGGDPQPLAECSEVGWHDPADLPADSLPWLRATLTHQLDPATWLHESLS